MTGRLVLIVIGHNSAGKSTAARYLASVLSGEIVEFGEIVKKLVAEDQSLPRDPSLAFEVLVERHGPGWLCTYAERARRLTSNALILVGVRDLASYRALRDRWPAAVSVAVLAEEETRYARDAEKQTRVLLTRCEFSARDQTHTSWGLDELLTTADIVITNDSSVGAFRTKLAQVATELVRHNGHANAFE